MCGIAGVINVNKTIHLDQLKAVTKVLHHRGPDDHGYFINDTHTVGLAHTRLSFLDLSERGHQPMQNHSKTLVITYNGEIYNFKSLREELISAGKVFFTETDTEVLLTGYEVWGEKLPEKLDGMFAFAIYDTSKNELFLARDHFGIKPLFYSSDNSQFYFSSEVKGILELNPGLKSVRKESISLFLANRYIPTPYTIWENILKLEPGHSLKVRMDTMKVSKRQYWKLKKSQQLKASNVQDEVESLMYESVRNHLISDVEIGSFLSGGFDSSLLVYIMQQKLYYPTQAFAIGFDNWDQSEHMYAQQVADAVGAKLHVKKEQAIDLGIVKKLMWFYDDPIADISIIPTFEVSGLAAQHVKAVVSGEGADESHAGYWWDKPNKFIFKNKWYKLKHHFSPPSFPEIKYHYIQAMSMGLFDVNELKLALAGTYAQHIPNDPFSHFEKYFMEGEETTHQIQYLDIYTFMSDLILTKVDRASMAHSLEVRVPFLNKQLVEYLYNLNTSEYLANDIQKPVIRSMLKNHVPDTILNRPKQGFVGPDSFYMNFPLYKSTLISGRLVEEHVVKQDYIERLLMQKDHWRLWKLFVLENWWQVWM